MAFQDSKRIVGARNADTTAKLLHWLAAVALLVLGLLPPVSVAAQTPSFEVDEIGVAATGMPGVYKFYPMFRGQPCTASQLAHHIFEWEFSPTDYSVQATPERTFYTATPLNVRLRVGGIKEDIDPDNTPAGDIDPDPTNNIFRELPPASWGTLDIGPIQFTPSAPMAQQTYVARPKMRLIRPDHEPVPGENYPFLVELENSTLQCDYDISMNLQLKVNGMPTPLVRNHVAPAITCTPNNSSCGNLKLKLPAKTRVVVPFTAAIPVGDERIGQSVVLGVGGKFDISGSTECTKFTDSLALPLRVVRSVDPNSKTCLNGPLFLPGGIVQFSVQFHNTGNVNAHHIVIWDTLDPRFDAAQAEPVSVVVNGATIQDAAAGNPSFYTFSQNTGDRALQFKITLDATHGLGPNEIGNLVFQVPIELGAQAQTPDELETTKDSCLQLLVLQNTAVTMFEEEGRRYGSTCIPPVKVVLRNDRCCKATDAQGCPKWVWAVMIALLLVILSLLAFYRRRPASSN